MLPVAPPGGASPLAPSTPAQRTHPTPHTQVLLALPPTAASAAVLRGLRAEGLSVGIVSAGAAVLDVVRARDPALLVLDVGPAGTDVTTLLAAVQTEAPDVPVIAVTPREHRAPLLGLLRGDLDDYLLRPFAVDDLAARIRLRLRLGPRIATTTLRQGELVVDTLFGEVTVGGQRVSLSPTEYALLRALIADAGAVVSPDRLARQVWAEPASANLVQVYISYLRRKIGSERIRTVRGAGYVLEA